MSNVASWSMADVASAVDVALTSGEGLAIGNYSGWRSAASRLLLFVRSAIFQPAAAFRRALG